MLVAKWLLVGVGLYVVALVYLYLTQESSIFNAKAAKFGLFTCKECQEISLGREDGIQLSGKGRFGKSSRLLLYFGGNADDATTILKYLDSQLDTQVVAFNYRGYGLSSGQPTQERLFGDALAIYDAYAKGKEVIVMGRSLGTGIAVYLASMRPVEHVILITPFDSIRAIAKRKYPYFPIDWLIRHPFDSIKYAPSIDSKVSVVEVVNDSVVPNANTDNLLKAMSNIHMHIKLHNTTHGDVLEEIDFKTLLGIPSKHRGD